MSSLSQIKRKFVFAAIASAAVVIVAAFQWAIIDRLSPLLFLPLAGLIWIFFAAVALASFACLFRVKTLGRVAFAPLAMQLLAVLVVYFVPFTDLWLQADFALYQEQREDVVRKVNNGELQPNVRPDSSLIRLGNEYSNISASGNEILVEEHAGKKYVFFFTFRGILDSYAGFLFVPEEGDPALFSDLGERESTQIVPLEGNWVYASHR